MKQQTSVSSNQLVSSKDKSPSSAQQPSHDGDLSLPLLAKAWGNTQNYRIYHCKIGAPEDSNVYSEATNLPWIDPWVDIKDDQQPLLHNAAASV